jgi:hypothetical protein
MHEILFTVIILSISFSIIHISLIINQIYLLVIGAILTIICLNISVHITGEKYRISRMLYLILCMTPIITGIFSKNFLQGLITTLLLEFSVIMSFIMHNKIPLTDNPDPTLQEDTITEPLPAYLPKCPSYVNIV